MQWGIPWEFKDYWDAFRTEPQLQGGLFGIGSIRGSIAKPKTVGISGHTAATSATR